MKNYSKIYLLISLKTKTCYALKGETKKKQIKYEFKTSNLK